MRRDAGGIGREYGVSVCFFDSSSDLDGEQESSEGRRFEALRSNLPAFKEKDFLLEAVARSQVRKSKTSTRKSKGKDEGR